MAHKSKLNEELPEGIITKVVLEIDPPVENLITYYVINEHKDYIPVWNEDEINPLNKLTEKEKEGLIVNFIYKPIKLKGTDEVEKEIIMAEIVEKEEENFNALLVGIDNYKDNPIRGSVNGVKKLEKLMLEKLKYEGGKIKKLLNEKATKSTLLFYLNKMVSDAKVGSRLFFYFSGHGAYRENKTENKTEGICPFDYDPEDIKTMISEDELEAIFKDLKKKELKLTFICDSCFSEGVMESDPSNNFMPIFFDSIGPDNGNVMISACSRVRYAHNFPFEYGYCAVLTYYLVENLQAAVDDGAFGKLLSEVIKKVHKDMIPLGLLQAPGIKGDQPISELLSANEKKEVVHMN